MRMNALQSMLKLETAAGEWWSKMSPQEQEVYKKAHPHSKMSKNGVSAPPSAGEKPTMGPYRMSMHINEKEASPKGLAHSFQKRGFHTTMKPLKSADGETTHQLNVHYHPHQSSELHKEMQRHGGDEVFGGDKLYRRLKNRAGGKPGRDGEGGTSPKKSRAKELEQHDDTFQ